MRRPPRILESIRPLVSNSITWTGWCVDRRGRGAVEAQERGLNPSQSGPKWELPLSSRAHRLITKPLPVKAGSRRVVLLPALKAQIMLFRRGKKKKKWEEKRKKWDARRTRKQGNG